MTDANRALECSNQTYAYVYQRIRHNLNRIAGNKVAIYPYGRVGRAARRILEAEFGIEPAFLIDNFSGAETDGVMTFPEYLEGRRDESVVLILAVQSMELVRGLTRELLQSGIRADRLVILYHEMILGIKALERVLNLPNQRTLLDVGCGAGLQGRIFEDYGKRVTGLTMSEHASYDGGLLSNVVQADFLRWTPDQRYDVVWASHVLEHVRDVEAFLSKAREAVKEGGCLAITVPSSERNILLAHVHMFNAGRILRYLLGAGFDCRNAEILVYGYNLSVILPEVAWIPEQFDLRVLEAEAEGYERQEGLLRYLPAEIALMPAPSNVHYFNGEIDALNWDESEWKVLL